MKTLIRSAVLFFIVSLPAFGDQMYRGTITQTVTDTGGSPLYHDGENFNGYYEYTSPTVNGSFFTADVIENFGFPPDTNESLGGLMFITLPWDGVVSDYGLGTNAYGELDVSGGEVSAFAWQLDNGGDFSVFSADGFSSESYDEENGLPPTGLYPDITVSGSVSFGAPTAVPDSGQTVWVLLLGVFICFCLRGRTARRMRLTPQ
jgi:hypothetical protein